MTDNVDIIAQPNSTTPTAKIVGEVKPVATERITREELEKRLAADEERDRRNANLAQIEIETGAQWTAIRPNSKAPAGQSWQERPASIDDLTSHPHGIGLLCGQHSNNIILLDLDEDASGFLDRHPQLRQTLAIWTVDASGNATDRIKIAIRITDHLPHSSAHKAKNNPDTFDTDILAEGRQGVIWGPHPSGGSYRCNWKTEIIELSFDDLDRLWRERTGKRLEPANSSHQPTAQPPVTTHARTDTDSPQSTSEGPIRQAKNLWTCADVFAHFDLGEERQEAGGVRFLGNGGLIANGNGWYNHSEQIGGNALDAWHWCKCGETLHNESGDLAYQIALEMLAERGIEVNTKPDISAEIETALDYLASFNLKDNNLVDAALAVIQVFEENHTLEAAISCRDISLRGGMGKDTAAVKLAMLSAEGRRGYVRALRKQKRTAIELSERVDDDMSINELISILPDSHHESFMRSLSKNPDDTETIRQNKIELIRKKPQALQAKIDRVENGSFPDLLILKKRGDGILANEYCLDPAKDQTHQATSATSRVCLIFRGVSDTMSDDAFLRNMPQNESGRGTKRVDRYYRVTAEEDTELIASYGKTGARIVALLEISENKTLSQAEIAGELEKHSATIKTTLDRMTATPAALPEDTPTIIKIDWSNGRKKRVTLADNWREILNIHREHMTTNGLTERRRRRYAEERVERILTILPEVSDVEKQKKYSEILINNQCYLAQFKATGAATATTITDAAAEAVTEPAPNAAQPAAVAHQLPATDPHGSDQAITSDQPPCTRQSFVIDASGLYKALSKMTGYRADLVRKFFFAWSRTSKSAISRMVDDLGLDQFVDLEGVAA